MLKVSVVVFGFFALVAHCADDLKIDVISKPEVCEPRSKNGDMLTMHYTGTLADGTKFDSSPPCEALERTFLMIKPDGVQRGLVGKIINRFEEKGFKLVGIKFVWPSAKLLEQHYAEHEGKPFLPGLIKFMTSGPVVPMVWEGPNVVKIARLLIGSTNPSQADPATIRGTFGLQSGRNLIHGSDSVESAQREIRLWFEEWEVVAWRSSSEMWFYED